MNFICTDSEELARNVRPFIAEVETCIHEAGREQENIHALIMRCLNQDGDIMSCSEAADELERYAARLRGMLNRAYSVISSQQLYESFLDYQDAVSAFSRAEISAEGADGFSSGGRIYLRCGMLPAPAARTVAKKGEGLYAYGTQYADDSLYRIMSGIMDEQSIRRGSSIRVFEKKSLHFLYCYSSADRRNEADSDNHYTRKIQNAVTSLLPGGDSGTSCSIAYETRITDRVPTGTYITISPFPLRFPTPEHVISVWDARLKRYPAGERI